jgi:ethanolamine-phosphate cytidylyltransferase
MSQVDTYLNEKRLLKEKEGKVRKTRGIVEGVFDLTHFGHFGVIRQAKLMCDFVILLINSDRAVLDAKGPTVYTENERVLIGKACKWVD